MSEMPKSTDGRGESHGKAVLNLNSVEFLIKNREQEKLERCWSKGKVIGSILYYFKTHSYRIKTQGSAKAVNPRKTWLTLISPTAKPSDF